MNTTIKAQIERNVTRDLVKVLDNAWQINVKGSLDTEKYSIEALKVALECDFISDNNMTYALTYKGKAHLKFLLDLSRTYSENRNVFKYSSYWQTWSRVLFHMPTDARSDHPHHKLKADLGIDSPWVEIDLTAVNSQTRNHWESHVQYGNIRTHSTEMRKDDIITGFLPGSVVHEMLQWLKPDIVHKLIHGDYLPHIAFERLRLASNGGAAFKNCMRHALSHEEYHLRMSRYKPDVTIADVAYAYKLYMAELEAKRNLLWIDRGMIIS